MEVALGVTACCMQVFAVGSAHCDLSFPGRVGQGCCHRGTGGLRCLIFASHDHLPPDLSSFVLVAAQQPFWGGHGFPSGASDALGTILWQAAHQGPEPQDLKRK